MSTLNERSATAWRSPERVAYHSPHVPQNEACSVPAMQRAAIEYIVRGYSVVPLHGVDDGGCTCRKGAECPSAGKHPIRAGWAERPLRSAEEVGEFWGARGNRPTNIGILLKRSDRLLLVDVDSKSGGKCGPRTIRNWSAEAGIDFDEYMVQDTPSGGWHCLFRLPEDFDGPLPNRAEVAPGIDVFCEDRQFVVAPSRTALGEYRNERGDAVVLPPIDELPLAPDWMLERLRSAPGGRSRTRGADRAGSPPDLAGLCAPNVEIVSEVVGQTPNPADAGYDDYIKMAHCIKGACGPDHEADGLEIYQEWSERWTGVNDPQTNRDKFDSVHWDRLQSGWPHLLQFCESLGLAPEVVADAKLAEAEEAFDFEDGPDPEHGDPGLDGLGPDGWDVPIPIVDDDHIEPFPIETLPPAFRRYVASVAESQEVPVDVPAISLLGAVAGAAQQKYRGVRVHSDYLEPISTYLICQLHSGEGKTAVASEFRRPFEAAQGILREQALPAIARARAKHEVMDQEAKGILVDIKSTDKKVRDLVFAEDAKGEEERRKLERRQERLAERLEQIRTAMARCEIPAEPLLWITEGTPEAISEHLAKQSNLIVSGSEGDLIDVFAGQYTSKGTAKLGPLLSAYSGESYAEARKDGVREVTDPRVSVILSVQPSVVEKMRQQPEFASRGLTPRFLYSAPKSLVGSRTWEMKVQIDREGRDMYRQLIGSLVDVELHEAALSSVDLSDLEIEDEDALDDESFPCRSASTRPWELRLSPDALDAYLKYRRAIEPALVDEDDALSGFAAWGNKLPGQMLRIAGVLHVLERAEEGDFRPWHTPVPAETIERAIQIAEYFRSHMARLFVEQPQVKERLILDRLKERGQRVFSPRGLCRSVRRKFNGMADLDATLRTLEDFGWIRERHVVTRGRRRRECEVNPHLWDEVRKKEAPMSHDGEGLSRLSSGDETEGGQEDG